MKVAESRVPKRRGGLYCSPACGGHCTWLGYLQALTWGEEVAERLNSDFDTSSWTSAPLEDCGWRAQAINGSVAVLRRSDRDFLASGGTEFQVVVGGATPVKAIEAMVRELEHQAEAAVQAKKLVIENLYG